ncbi:MAG: glycosyltransferase family 4 protein [Cyclobacteriaceae bacterium]|nr:glycosyltransferase family 4 protein [Cyclobacteriaceae bacterium]
MKIAFFAPYPINTVASQRFRFEQYFNELEKKGIDHNLYSFYPRWAFEVLYKEKHYFRKTAGIVAGFMRRSIQLLKSLDADYVLIHRELTPLGPPVFEWILIQVFKKQVIFDFDDAIWIPDESSGNRWFLRLKWHQKVAYLCRKSCRVSAGNQYLADFALRYNSRITINPTTVDTSKTAHIKVNHRKEHVTIGWTGTHTTMKYLEMILDPLQKILNEYEQASLLIICNHQPAWKIKKMEFIRWKKTGEWDDLSRIHVGLMPLPEDPWTLGKCGFKILEYFSLGIPALASPVGFNSRLIDHGGNGFLCRNGSEWIKYLEILIQDPSRRTSMGASGKKLVEDAFSLTSNRDTFLGLFE